MPVFGGIRREPNEAAGRAGPYGNDCRLNLPGRRQLSFLFRRVRRLGGGAVKNNDLLHLQFNLVPLERHPFFEVKLVQRFVVVGGGLNL